MLQGVRNYRLAIAWVAIYIASIVLVNWLFAPAQLVQGFTFWSTPFGDFYLDPSQTILLGTVPAGAGPPFVLRRVMPSNPALIGTTFSFQARTDSAAAPSGAAYTNPTSFVVLP